jgi:hypothetical protein
MAKIWLVYEGRIPTLGGDPWVDLPLSETIDIFKLRPGNYLSDLGTIPRFGHADRDLSYAGYKHIVVEVGSSEGRQARWKPGFYRSSIKPEDAYGLLIKQALAAELGDENVVRVELEPTMDSQGQDALRITVVISPNATKKIRGGATLDALVRLQKRLHEMRDNRTPIVQYATEAELKEKEDVGS